MRCASLSHSFNLHHLQCTFRVVSGINLACYVGPFLCLLETNGFQKFKRFKNTCNFSLYVQLWRTAQCLVSHTSQSQKLAKRKKKIGFTKCFGMVSVKVFPSICLSSEQIRIFNQKMYKCSIVRDTIWWPKFTLPVDTVDIAQFRSRLHK